MQQETIAIAGMHCRSCEILIGDELKRIPSIKLAKLSYKKGSAVIYYFTRPPQEQLEKAITTAGYTIGKSPAKNFINKHPEHLKDITYSLIILLFLFLIIKKTSLFSGFGISGNYSSLPIVLLVGLTAGFSTCMAMIGGLVLGVSARFAEKHSQATSIEKFTPHLYFNLGRIIGFVLFGGLIGLLGSAFQLSGPGLGILTIFVGFVMIVLGLQLTEVFPWLNSGIFTLPSGLAKTLHISKRNQKEYSHRNTSILGALTFFLPCGFTQAMQLYAISTGSFKSGALVMGLFALGTAPGLLGVGGITSTIKGIFARRFFKFAGFVVLILALVNISNGYNLTGWHILASNYKQPAIANPDDPNVEQKDGIQIVRMTQKSTGYSPNKFTILQNIPTKWIINAEDTSSCSASISSSGFGIRTALKRGENIIEFTPNQLGEIKFSCLMGMYRGSFLVIENKSLSQTTPTPSITATAQPSSSITNKPNPSPSNPTPQPTTDNATQILSTIYTLDNDISPNTFDVKTEIPVKFKVDVKDDGEGCMSTIMIPGLYDEPRLLEKNKTIEMSFIAFKKGTYEITCAMGVPRGTITVT